MSKLIGTNPNQVPSNADLGSAAFMDKKEFLLSKGGNLNAINNIINETAVDVFVYDTKNDSDGGAWRHRTHHTSWYNETLNTDTRGSRREFPSVAVIVATQQEIIIYDADDSDMPMWMVFEYIDGVTNGTQLVSVSDSRYWTSVCMLNGRLAAGMGRHTTTGMGIDQADFILDGGWRIRTGGGSNYKGTYRGNIAQRRDTTYDGVILGNITNETIMDIDMRVLPDAPIDPLTGIQVPTVAVATESGVNVLRDTNNEIYSITESVGTTDFVRRVKFLDDERITFNTDDPAGSAKWTVIKNIPRSNQTYGYLDESDVPYVSYAFGASNARMLLGPPWNGDASTPTTSFTTTNGNVVQGTEAGIGIGTTQKIEDNAINNNMVAQITSEYNTGWMAGLSKIATLMDTDTSPIRSREQLTGNNSSFTSGLGDWQGFNATLSQVNNALRVADAGGYSAAYLTVDTEVGKSYVFSAYVSNNGQWATISASENTPTGSAWGTYGTTRTQSNGFFSFAFTANTTTTYLILGSESTTSTDYDSLSFQEAVSDRSYLNDGVSVYGSLYRNTVAAGADLVSYSGFSTNNFLKQRYNSSLNYGTDDFHYNMWFKSPDTSQMGLLIHRSATESGDGTWTTSGSIVQMEFNTTSLRAGIWNNAFGSTTGYIDEPYATFKNDVWHMITLLRRGDHVELFHNGKFLNRAKDTNIDLNNSSDAQLWIGNRPNVGDRPFNGEIALLKSSRYAPTPEQIEKMYNDEKKFFADNAKATIYGTDSNVTAVSYDDNLDQLHVGTSQGRSVFTDLVRIDNTTDPVSSTISARNGVVAED